MGKIENCLINLPTEMEAQGPHNTICKEHEVGNRKYWKVLRGPTHTRKLASSSARWRCGTMTTKHRCTTPPSTEGTRSLSFSSAEVWAVRHGQIILCLLNHMQNLVTMLLFLRRVRYHRRNTKCRRRCLELFMDSKMCTFSAQGSATPSNIYNV